MSDANPFRNFDRATPEAFASDVTTGSSSAFAARAELLRRDQEDSEMKEASRRLWEDEREQSRRTFETKMFEATGNRTALQQDHEEKLAKMQAAAAREAATIQAQATEKAADQQVRVARLSAAAAIAAAVAALVSLAITVILPLLK